MPLIESENFVDIGISIGINYSYYSTDYSANVIMMIILLMLFY